MAGGPQHPNMRCCQVDQDKAPVPRGANGKWSGLLRAMEESIDHEKKAEDAQREGEDEDDGGRYRSTVG
eukprot:COSAG01_NODE_2336_length_7874_cov_42.809928_6_plen_69_part_00